MSTEINRLSLTLPAGFGDRAGRIARRVGDALAQYELPAGRHARLAVGPVRIDARSTDRMIAARIADAIATRIRQEGH